MRRTCAIATRLIAPTTATRLIATKTQSKVGGDISSVFRSLSGIPPPPLSNRYAKLKSRFTSGRRRILAEPWERLLLDLEKAIAVVKRYGIDIIPQVQYKDLACLSKEEIAEIKKRGVVVVRNVIPDEEALAMKKSLKDHIKRYQWTKAFPADSPAVYELYWSLAQRAARAHSPLVASQRFVNSLWHSSLPSSVVDTSVSLPYADRFRIRKPGDAGFALEAHIDGGSLERWEDPEYSRCYEKIWTGQWEEYDPYNAEHRVHAKMDMYDGAGSCGVWRSWQGWLSLSTTYPGEGTLLVNPLLKHTTAYTILRPFFTLSNPPTLSTTPRFPNSVQGACQEYSNTTHPHLCLADSMTHVPRVSPGDYDFWHCDTIHAVDRQVSRYILHHIPKRPTYILNHDQANEMRIP
ncbi:unnamed protein product [Tuber melanosporum]|uniref:(Perigord truffle) hypothetical protein n=1 Tax=Tuber melanosporum (strain Mel28) TaxID=656061 RepID=D5GG89_TUBMM|nr:uncharacterized protein GSTUM_00007263001 [Tuber melanosporum]CAZ83532.1 unnamed protein product [Tuber melanosporum]